MDDSTRDLSLPPAVRAAVSPAVAALRWGSIGFGMVFAAPQAFRGSYAAVVSLGVCLFVTTWRTTLPIRLGGTSTPAQVAPMVDIVIFGVAVGYGGGLESSLIFCVVAAVVVVAFGWGLARGLLGLVISMVALVIGVAIGEATLSEQVDDPRDIALIAVMVVGVFAGAFIRNRLIDAERRRSDLAGQVDALAEANDLLSMLNTVARTLPSALTLREALDRIRSQLMETFDTRVIALLTLDETSGDWVPKLSESCALRPSYRGSELPNPLATAMVAAQPVLRGDFTTAHHTGISPASTSGLYVRLESRGEVVGLLALEHPDPNHFDQRSVRLLGGLSEVLALTVDNARWFGRLRSLGAEEERIRIARDLHDRLGQWLTYISFELERIMDSETDRTEELQHLHGDVLAALDDLRETLRQLRAGVSDEQPLATVGRTVVDRFTERTEVQATFVAPHPEDRLPIPVENELLRILQEALNNVDKHARADHVIVTWDVVDGQFELTVSDDGRGFDLDRGVRDSAYGLVGMRERADVIGAHIDIESEPGGGTTVRVYVPSNVTEEVIG